MESISPTASPKPMAPAAAVAISPPPILSGLHKAAVKNRRRKDSQSDGTEINQPVNAIKIQVLPG